MMKCDQCGYLWSEIESDSMTCPQCDKQPTGQAMRLRTIAEVFERVPEDRIDAFLADLGNMMRTHKQLMRAVSSLAGTRCRLDLSQGMTWIDDGKHDVSLRLGYGSQEPPSYDCGHL